MKDLSIADLLILMTMVDYIIEDLKIDVKLVGEPIKTGRVIYTLQNESDLEKINFISHYVVDNNKMKAKQIGDTTIEFNNIK